MAKNDGNESRTGMGIKIETIGSEGQGQGSGSNKVPPPSPPPSPSPLSSSPLPADSSIPFVLTAEQFMTMMKEMVREMKRDPELETKNTEEKRRLDVRRRHRVRLATAEIERRNRLQSLCNHRKGPSDRDEPCLGGQVFSDGYERKICLRCQKIVVEVQAPELTAAADIMKTRMMQKAKELGIEDVVEDLFTDLSAPRIHRSGLVTAQDEDDE